MRCQHKHVVVHRDDVEEHKMPEDGSETACSCGPGLICPVCDWDSLYADCFIAGPSELVDAKLVTPDKSQFN